MAEKSARYLILSLLAFFCLINFLTVFTPEIGFDAIWYHLTLPKLFLDHGNWYFPGGLLYYSVLPRLYETISIPLLYFFGIAGPKFVQFASGIAVGLMTYKMAYRQTSDSLKALVATSLVYGTWVVSWQSGSAYLDLFRTALEFGAVYFYLSLSGKKKIIIASVLLGLALGTKHHALFSLFLFATFVDKRVIPLAFLIGFPWYLLAFHFTGNPFYPLFTEWMRQSQLEVMGQQFYQPWSLGLRLFTIPWHLTFPYDDFISPVIGLVFLIALHHSIKSKFGNRYLTLGLVGVTTTLFLPPPSSRYLLPFLPLIIIGAVSSPVFNVRRLWLSLLMLAVTSSFSILVMRLVAFQKYIPFLLGKQTQNEFLTTISGRLPQTFIDTDDFVTNLPNEANYLIDNLHNLYYFPHKFSHTSWVKDQTNFDYLITTGTDPLKMTGRLIHTNQIGIQIYKL